MCEKNFRSLNLCFIGWMVGYFVIFTVFMTMENIILFVFFLITLLLIGKYLTFLAYTFSALEISAV